MTAKTQAMFTEMDAKNREHMMKTEQQILNRSTAEVNSLSQQIQSVTKAVSDLANSQIKMQERYTKLDD